MTDQTTHPPATGIDRVARSVSEVKSFDPGLGSYSFSNLGDAVRFSDLMCKAGEMLPEHLRDKPALCLAVIMRAVHWGFDPFALAMETYQAKSGGPIGYQAKVFMAAAGKAGIRLRYRYEGTVTMLDKAVTSSRGNEIAKRTATGDRKCIAYVVIDGASLEYETLPLDGITIKNSPQWHNDPDQQLAYMAGRGWVRRYRAEVMMGAYSEDEVREMEPMRDVTPREERPSGFIAKAKAARQVITPEEAMDADVDRHWTEDAPIEGADQDAPAFAEGREAFGKGVLARDCPFDEGAEEAVDWLAGHAEAAGGAS